MYAKILCFAQFRKRTCEQHRQCKSNLKTCVNFVRQTNEILTTTNFTGMIFIYEMLTVELCILFDFSHWELSRCAYHPRQNDSHSLGLWKYFTYYIQYASNAKVHVEMFAL